MYVDFEYYTNTFGGSTIAESDFVKYERNARTFLNQITFDRLTGESVTITDNVKDCLCEVMECNYKLDVEEAETGGKIIASESVDSHSVTYAISDIEKNEIDKSKIKEVKYYAIAKRYLSNTGLLYRGL